MNRFRVAKWAHFVGYYWSSGCFNVYPILNGVPARLVLGPLAAAAIDRRSVCVTFIRKAENCQPTTTITDPVAQLQTPEKYLLLLQLQRANIWTNFQFPFSFSASSIDAAAAAKPKDFHWLHHEIGTGSRFQKLFFSQLFRDDQFEGHLMQIPRTMTPCFVVFLWELWLKML